MVSLMFENYENYLFYFTKSNKILILNIQKKYKYKKKFFKL